MKQVNAVAWSLALLGQADALRLLGRVDPATRELTWPGTGVSFTFTGTSATIELEEVTGANSVLLTVDGKDTIIPNVNGTSIQTPAGLQSGSHSVELRKRSEAVFGSIFVGNVTTDGTLGPDIKQPRKIQFIGDSITVGYGLDGTFPCVDTAVLQDNPKTYASLAAKSLNAEFDVVAWSGRGLVRNTAYGVSDNIVMPQIWTRYGANDADNSYAFPASETPDAVVIGLGTNDFSVDSSNPRPTLNRTQFTSAMVTFIQDIAKHYPKAQFFLLQSPMLSDGSPPGETQWSDQRTAFESAAAQVNGTTKVTFVGWNPQGSAVGCDYHPNAATHAAEAPVVASAIAKALGW